MRSTIGCALALTAAVSLSSGATDFKLHGKAWFEGGRIMEAKDTLINGTSGPNILNLKGNIIQSVGAQFTVTTDLSENLEAGFGFGLLKVNHALGHGPSSMLAISLFQNYLTQSRLTWYSGEKEAPSLALTVGSFAYDYNPDVKNLGLYLLRGPVYPGILMSGFREFAVDTSKATMLGLRLHHAIGGFSQDLILNNEREIPPTLDWSLGYVAKYNAGPLTIGAGINFYRLIAYDKKLETPGKYFSDIELGFKKGQYIDTVPGSTDTTFLTHQGQKVMGMATLDFQQLFGMELANPDDFKLYTEVALIGIKNYGTIYAKRSERLPVMVGFNIPTAGLLNHLSLEVEYYKSPYRNDLVRIGNNNVVADWTTQQHPIASPKPPEYSDYGLDTAGVNGTINVKGTALDKEHVTKDDIKWSLFFDKTLSGHISLMGQVANDHFRPRPMATGLINSEGGTQEAFSSMSDWYFMLRFGYFF
jgi:hypothetical protein